MRRLILTASWCLVVAGAGCKKSPDGLAPATDWQTTVAAAPSGDDDEMPGPPPAIGLGRAGSQHGPVGGDPNDPHAGLAMGGGDPSDPHAGLDLGGGDPSDPHAGLDLSGGDQSPHGGGMDVTKLGLQGPDPDRPIDPSHRVTGLITVAAAAKAQAKPGTAIFLIVKRVDSSGAPTGSPLAVDKLTWSGEGVPFELTEAQAMIAGTDLSGDVVVTARYDQDSDAISKQPGDIVGQVRVKIPADDVKLTLDTVLP